MILLEKKILIQTQNISSPLQVRQNPIVLHDNVFKYRNFTEHLMRAEEKPFDLKKL